jgi:hypothetical protein
MLRSSTARTISKSFFAESVNAPGFRTSAGRRHLRPTSRSVAAMSMPPPLEASMSTLERMGIVFFLSTIP